MSSFYLFIAHGSREKKSNEGLNELLLRFKQAFPKRQVLGCFLQLGEPSVPEGIEQCIQEGANQVFLIPLLFFEGKHVKHHIPSYIEQARALHPDVQFHYASPISDDPLLLDLLNQKLERIHPAHE